jgi:CRP-like cAMP-binding protein
VKANEKKKKPAFNVDTFLATMDGGRSISTYRKNQTVFSQGDSADAVFYIQEGKVKVCVVNSIRRGTSSARAAYRVSRSGWRPPRP